MKKSKVFLCSFLVLALLLPALSACTAPKATPAATATALAPAPATPQPDQIVIGTEVQDYIHEVVDSENSRGIVVALITPDGVTYHSYGKTAVDGEPVNERTIYEIGSISKAFTAILLSDMVEQGKMALDDPVKKYLPADVTMPGGDAITLEYLATQRSGLPGIPDNLDAANPNPYAGYTADMMYTFLSGYTLTRDPDTQYEYSNLGLGLLGHVLSLVSGMSYEELVIDRISKPLGMDDTRITLSEEQKSRFAKGHDATGNVASNWDFDCLAGCGALRSTATDMARFVQANLALYETDLYPALQRTHESRAETGQANLKMGLGWHVLTVSGAEIVWHNGGTGGYRSFCGFIPSQKVGVVVLSNATFDIDYIGLHLLAPEIGLPAVQKTVSVATAVLETYVGAYELTPELLFEVTLEGETLMVQLTGQPALPVFPSSEVDFFYKAVDAQITFEKDDAGKVTALVLHQGGLDQPAKKVR